VIADGFSCREQIEQTTSRRALHLAEVLQLAYHADTRAVADAASPEASASRLAPHALAPRLLLAGWLSGWKAFVLRLLANLRVG
jgi:hypothetical protein